MRFTSRTLNYYSSDILRCPQSLILMPKTRRAGRKNQLRRLAARHYTSVSSNEYLIALDSDYYNDPLSERLSNTNVQIVKDIDESLFWELVPITFIVNQHNTQPRQIYENDPRCWKLTPITFCHRNLPPLEIPEEDPRRKHYLEKRTSIIREILSKVSEQRVILRKANVSSIPQ